MVLKQKNTGKERTSQPHLSACLRHVAAKKVWRRGPEAATKLDRLIIRGMTRIGPGRCHALLQSFGASPRA